MRALLFSFAMLAILAVGCEEAPVKSTVSTPVADSGSMAKSDASIDEVDTAGLKAAMAANDVTLIEFTAEW